MFVPALLSVLSALASAKPIEQSNPVNQTTSLAHYPEQGSSYTLLNGRYQLVFHDPASASASLKIPALNLKVAVDAFMDQIVHEIQYKGANKRVVHKQEFDKDGVSLIGYVPTWVAETGSPTLYDVQNLLGGLKEAYDIGGLTYTSRINARKRWSESALWSETWVMLLFYSARWQTAEANATDAVWS